MASVLRNNARVVPITFPAAEVGEGTATRARFQQPETGMDRQSMIPGYVREQLAVCGSRGTDEL